MELSDKIPFGTLKYMMLKLEGKTDKEILQIYEEEQKAYEKAVEDALQEPLLELPAEETVSEKIINVQDVLIRLKELGT